MRMTGVKACYDSASNGTRNGSIHHSTKKSCIATRTAVNGMKNDESEEMEREELGEESDKVVSSNNDDTDSDLNESGSDGDESSEMDEEEYDRRKDEFINEMGDLEKQFVALKEQLYIERMTQVDKKLEEVKSGKAIEYLHPLEELQENMRIRTEVAGILSELKLANIKCQYEAEMLASKQHFESENHLLKDQIRQDLEEKLRHLEEDRNSIDSDYWGDSFVNKKKKRFINNGYECGSGRDQLNLPDRRRKPVTIAGPYVIYMLRDSEILEDYNIIRKAHRPSSTHYF